MIQNRSALILGLSFVLGCVALGLILNMRPSGPGAGAPRIGRYQISGVPGHMFVLDTETGRVWEKWVPENSFNSGGFTRVTVPPPNPSDPVLNDLSDADDVRRFLEERKKAEVRGKRAE